MNEFVLFVWVTGLIILYPFSVYASVYTCKERPKTHKVNYPLVHVRSYSEHKKYYQPEGVHDHEHLLLTATVKAKVCQYMYYMPHLSHVHVHRE